MIKVLFVCLGNICRSPMAEGIFLHLVQEAGLDDQIEVDSCGTGAWHTGESADHRMRATAQRHGIHLPSRARQIKGKDFLEFDYIIPMDHSNLREVKQKLTRHTNPKSEVVLMRHFDDLDQDAEVPDPYYGGPEGFENVYDMLMRSNRNFLHYLVEKHKLKA